MSLSDISTTISLDLYDHDLTPSKIKAIALDSKTRYVNAQLTKGGQQYDIGRSTTVTLTIIRPDKTGVQVTGTTYSYLVYIDGTETTMYGARAELTQTALAVSGTLQAQFMFTSGEQILRSEIFTINNGVALDSTVSEWAGEYQGYNLDELVQNVNSAVATVEGMEQDVTELKSGLTVTRMQTALYNAMNLVAFRPVKPTQHQGNATNNGITYEWHDDNTCSVSGTASSLSFNNIYSDNTHFPSWMKKGETYVFKGGTNVSLEVYFYKSGTYYYGLSVKNTEREYTIPADIDGLIMRLQVANGVTVSEIVSPICKVKGMPSNAELYEITNDLFNKLYNTAYVTDSASGSIAHFEDGADSIPMKSLKVNIEPVQSGSGNPSPENVRSISGWTGVRVAKAGKNLISPLSKTESGLTLTPQSDGGLLINGTYTGTTGWFVMSSYVLLKAGQAYALSAGGTENTIGLNGYGGANPVTPTADFTSNLRMRIENGQTFDNVVIYPQVEVGATPTEFEIGTSEATNISLSSAGTVYGGTLDVVSGVLTVDRAIKTFNGSEAWYLSNGGMRCQTQMPADAKSNSADAALVGAMSNEFVEITPNRTWDGARGAGFCIDMNTQLNVCQTGQKTMTVDSWKTWLASHNMQIVYPLDTPVTYNLTPAEVKSLLGINNIWSDAGDVDVEYRADTKLYIDKRLAEVTR